jgi:hypothetical protein
VSERVLTEWVFEVRLQPVPSQKCRYPSDSLQLGSVDKLSPAAIMVCMTFSKRLENRDP